MRRRFVRLFQPRFADLVASGAKTQTVRLVPKRMPKAGDVVSLRRWSDKPYRSPQITLLETRITSVEPIDIYGERGPGGCGGRLTFYGIQLNGRRLTIGQCEEFAKADGFTSFEEMAEWIRVTHGMPFQGIVISWNVGGGE